MSLSTTLLLHFYYPIISFLLIVFFLPTDGYSPRDFIFPNGTYPMAQ